MTLETLKTLAGPGASTISTSNAETPPRLNDRIIVMRTKRPPFWLRRLGEVKAELKGTRFPKSAEEGMQQCAMLSAAALRLMKEQAGGEKEMHRLLATLSAAEARHAKRWRRDCARFFGQ